MTVTGFVVGEPWPYPLRGEGMQALLHPGPEAIELMLVVSIRRPSDDEVTALRERPLRLALLPSPPLVWLLLSAEGLTRDAPYAIGLNAETDRVALLAAARKAHLWAQGTRGLVSITVVDYSGRKIRVLRIVSCTSLWFQTLADALVSADRPLSQSDYDAAIDRDLRRWPATADMLAAATVVEIGGR